MDIIKLIVIITVTYIYTFKSFLNIYNVICQLHLSKTGEINGSQDGGEEAGKDHVRVM